MKFRMPQSGHRWGLYIFLSFSGFLSSCNGEYVIRSIYFQAELLAHRIPIEDALNDPNIEEHEQRALRQITAYQSYAEKRGLKTGKTYSSVALNWPRTLFNISACRDDAFIPVTWSFPIVGEVPYLGFFRRKDSFPVLRELGRKENIEVYARYVGAYSTLGYFDDPILPGMLSRSPASMMRVVFHELTHGTLWLPGSVRFNESFASFVGDQLTLEYMRDHGLTKELEAELTRRSDQQKYEGAIRKVYEDLETLYTSGKSRKRILEEKKRIIEGIPMAVVRANLENPGPFILHVKREPWNNARLIQFKAYNDLKPAFARFYEQHNHDLVKMLSALEMIESEDEFEGLLKGESNAKTSTSSGELR